MGTIPDREATMVGTGLAAGITRAGGGQEAVVWNVLGHRYFLKASSDSCFCFETHDPPGTFVPLHVHPRQDEFIYMLRARSTSSWAKPRSRPGPAM